MTSGCKIISENDHPWIAFIGCAHANQEMSDHIRVSGGTVEDPPRATFAMRDGVLTPWLTLI